MAEIIDWFISNVLFPLLNVLIVLAVIFYDHIRARFRIVYKDGELFVFAITLLAANATLTNVGNSNPSLFAVHLVLIILFTIPFALTTRVKIRLDHGKKVEKSKKELDDFYKSISVTSAGAAILTILVSGIPFFIR